MKTPREIADQINPAPDEITLKKISVYQLIERSKNDNAIVVGSEIRQAIQDAEQIGRAAERERWKAFADDKGEPRNVCGELLTSEEGDIISDGARVYFPNESGTIIEWDVSGAGDHIPVGRFWISHAAALAAAAKGGQ